MLLIGNKKKEMLASYVYTLLVIFGILSTLFVAGIGRQHILRRNEEWNPANSLPH